MRIYYKMNEFRGHKCYAIAEIVPDHVLENIFCFLDLTDLRNCSVVCKTWSMIISDENNEVWRALCLRRFPEEVLKSDLLSSVSTYKRKLRAFYHAWNPHDCSRNIYIKSNGFTLHRNPVAQSTDACRAKIGFRYGRHAWEVVWEGPLGTVAVVGISTKEAPLQCNGYVGLLGSDQQSWGWNLVDNQLLHGGETHGQYPRLNNCPKYQIYEYKSSSSVWRHPLLNKGLPIRPPHRTTIRHLHSPVTRDTLDVDLVGERLRVILDCENKTLSFERNYEFLGVAFRGLPNKKLYPTVSAVYGNTEVSMVYLGPPVDG